ncbi:helix-turn-helix transcriptional regulator [Rhizobium sp. RHZ01]|uniref:helix-turn-helix domain-containing protein n=1 Tax=Rhizobium sp. RHZ01 TaxID=2769304 RepID=UPI00178612CB|nr:helix-turn-helix transcriptional regulator [Rhizobium sp. RHZ01]MBD9448504.1 helix-turn-helix transcriptional regulator [Rhizobium sp. RHZ01]
MKTEHLTEREIECLKFSAQGKGSVEIGLIPSLSPHTVNSYMQTAVKKLDARTERMPSRRHRNLVSCSPQGGPLLKVPTAD